MSALVSAPPPLHIIRSHTSAISALFISGDNERIFSGDISGLVVITSTRSLRPMASWKAHTDGLLGIEEWGKRVITHGRDNKLHIWNLPSQAPPTVRGSASAPDTLTLELGHSLDVNALNFCRFSLLPLDARGPSSTSTTTSTSADPRALVAVPNLVESSSADIWALPSMERIHAAIGKDRPDAQATLRSDGRGVKNPTGIIMSMHLLPAPSGAIKLAGRVLSLITSYENGSVKLWRYSNIEKERSIEGVGWDCIWSLKLHVESVMATSVSLDRSIALSVSADHLVGRYDLNAVPTSNFESAGTVYRTKHPGNGAVAFHDEGRVCAVGGWDGRVRLFSTKSFKALGTLIYHKAAVQALAFARACPVTALHRHDQHHSRYPAKISARGDGGSDDCRDDASGTRSLAAGTRDASRSGDDDDNDGDRGDRDDDFDRDCDDDNDITVRNNDGEEEEDGGEGEGDDEDDEMSAEEKARRSRWLVSGAKDGRVVVWALMDFRGEAR